MSKPNPSITSGAAKAPGAISAGAKRKKIIFTVIKIVAVIGVIIGLVFGIIALVHALSDPCAHSPGTSWDEETKLCTSPAPPCPDKELRCHNSASGWNGRCMPKNYCDYTDTDGHKYSYDEDSCECTISCAEGKVINSSDLSKSTTAMKPVGSIYEPEFNLVCGELCEFSRDGYCEVSSVPQTCAVSIDKDGNVLSALAGCDPWTNYSTCEDSNVKCLNKCSSNHEVILTGDDADSIGTDSFKYLKGKTVNNYCEYSKCPGDNKVLCVMGSQGDCGEGGSCIENNIFKKKGYKYLGTCNNSSNLENSFTCVNPNLIGEQKLISGGEINIKNLRYNVENPENTGISLNVPQCVRSPECNNTTLKDGWYCTDENNTCIYESAGEVLSCPEYPPTNELDLVCCDDNKVSKLGDNYFCCAGNTIHKDKGFGLCTNNSMYPPNPSWLGTDMTKIKCSSNSDCSNQENIEALQKKLKIQTTDPKSDDYGGFFCNPSSKKCNFFAGFREGVGKSGGVELLNKYFIGNDSTTSLSEAVNKNETIGWDTKGIWANQTTDDSNIFSCKDRSDDNYFGFYSQGEKIPGGRATGFTNSIILSRNDEKSVSNAICLNHLNEMSAGGTTQSNIVNPKSGIINDSSLSENTNFNSTNWNSKIPGLSTSASEPTACQFIIDCIGASSTVTDTNGKYVSLDWDFDSKSYPEGVKTRSGQEAYFLGQPKNTKIHFEGPDPPWGTGADGWQCSDAYKNQSDCEDINIPANWEEHAAYFKSPCKWYPHAQQCLGRNFTLGKEQGGLENPNYDINTGLINPNFI